MLTRRELIRNGVGLMGASSINSCKGRLGVVAFRALRQSSAKPQLLKLISQQIGRNSFLDRCKTATGMATDEVGAEYC